MLFAELLDSPLWSCTAWVARSGRSASSAHAAHAGRAGRAGREACAVHTNRVACASHASHAVWALSALFSLFVSGPAVSNSVVSSGHLDPQTSYGNCGGRDSCDQKSHSHEPGFSLHTDWYIAGDLDGFAGSGEHLIKTETLLNEQGTPLVKSSLWQSSTVVIQRGKMCGIVKVKGLRDGRHQQTQAISEGLEFSAAKLSLREQMVWTLLLSQMLGMTPVDHRLSCQSVVGHTRVVRYICLTSGKGWMRLQKDSHRRALGLEYHL